MLWYFPFECQADRYTMQLSAPNVGWNEAAWIKKGVDYRRVEGVLPPDMTEPPTLRGGTIFDLSRRSIWALSQVTRFLHYAQRGYVGKDDILYFDDFLHPGIEAIALSMGKNRPKMYAWMHGTCLDEYDFTADNMVWQFYFEKCVAKILSGTFVACPTLKNLLVKNWNDESVNSKIHATGHVWDTAEVRSRRLGGAARRAGHYKLAEPTPDDRWCRVVYASRWDTSKDPMLFLEVARRIKKALPEAEFTVCTSAPEVRSDDPALIVALNKYVEAGTVKVLSGLSKAEYYQVLATSKVVFSSSKMDWISYVLLEGSAFGAYPIFPRTWSFVDALNADERYLYTAGDVSEAVEKVVKVLIREDLWTPGEIRKRDWIHRRFDSTWDRRLAAMGYTSGPTTLKEWE